MAHDIQSQPTQQQGEITPQAARIEPSMSEGEAFKWNPDYHKMSDFLGVDETERFESDVANKIAFIRDFTGEQDEVEAMTKVRDLIKELGVQTKGKDLIKTLFQYTRLIKDRSRIDKEINLLKPL